jgi:hypothetical protein
VTRPAVHSHQCGMTAIGFLEGYGCGHIWEHDDKLEWTLAEHRCPRCGKGPFTRRITGDLRNELMLRDVHPQGRQG